MIYIPHSENLHTFQIWEYYIKIFLRQLLKLVRKFLRLRLKKISTIQILLQMKEEKNYSQLKSNITK